MLSIYRRIANISLVLGSVGLTAACLAQPSQPLQISPAAATVLASKSQQFSVSGSGNGGTAVKWLVAGIPGGNSTVGTISAGGMYTAPASVPASAIKIEAVGSGDHTTSASAAVTVQENAALNEAHEQWLAGAAKAAAGFGCTEVAVEQQPSETISEVIQIFLAKKVAGSCLVLQPISTNAGVVRYSYAWGGNVDGFDIYYLSDVGKLRIWNGTPTSGN